MKKFLLIFTFLISTFGLSSCVTECENTLYEQLVGRTWVGDLGFGVGNTALESGIKFNSNGFGVDEQRYMGGANNFFDNFEFSWWLEYDNIFLQYGNNGPNRGPQIELRNAYVRSGQLKARLFVDGRLLGDVYLQMF